MNATFKFDEKAFAEQAKRLAVFADKSIEEVVREQAGLAAIDCMRLTPPYGKRPLKESLAEQRRAGQRKVKIDVARAFQPLKSIHVVSNPRDEKVGKEVRRLIRKGDYLNLEAMLKQFGIRTLGIIKEATGQLLDQLRDRRGNVRKKVASYLVVSGASIGRLLRKQLSKVGLAKSGWVRCLDGLGRTDKVPAWIRGHAGQGVFAQTGHPGKPEVLIGNAVRYAQWRAYDILSFAMRERLRSATQQANIMERAIKRKLKEAGLQ
jgi:hypothetical protein